MSEDTEPVGWTYCFQTCARKGELAHDFDSAGWGFVDFERDDYTDMYWFRKPTVLLTEDDKIIAESCGYIPSPEGLE